jgi:alginate production protein
MKRLPPYANRGDPTIGGRRSLSRVFTTLLAIFIGAQAGGFAAQLPTEPAPRPPVFDPEAPPKTRFRLAPFLTFGAEVELEFEFEKNFDLDDAEDDDLAILTPELSLAFSFDPSKYFQAFVNFELLKDLALVEPETEERRVILRLTHAYLSFKELADGRLSLQLGRQRFDDEREWLYDEELDAVRVFYRWSRLELEASVSRRDLMKRDLFNAENRERINNYILYGKYDLTKDIMLAAYSLLRDDRSPDRERPIFFGLHSSGEIIDDFDYWLELAHVRGRDGSRRIRGYGFDLGASYESDLPLRPAVTVGYAFGSGDAERSGRVDRNFRQTGLQDNEDRFHGVTSFKYYGELFDPELSNLMIITGGIGIRPTRRSSIDLVYHYYLQHKASDEIRDTSIDADPTGRSKRLGTEIDLILGYEEIRNVEVKVALGYFIPGKAFGTAADDAFFTGVEIEWNF